MAREEEKLPWREVPASVRAEVERVLGGRVARGSRAWGGYSPSVTLRMELEDGRRAFLKASNAESSDFNRDALCSEVRIYRELGDTLLKGWAPAVLGSFSLDDWLVLLLEDLGPASVPPWTRQKAQLAAEEYGRFHASTQGAVLPEWVRPTEQASMSAGWDSLTKEAGGLEQLSLLAGEQASDARRWLDEQLPRLATSARTLAGIPGPHSLLHLDTRSDNIRLVAGRLRIFDWPWVTLGPPELDLAAFAQTIPGEEGGPPAEDFVRWYAAQQSVRAEVLDACVSAVAAFFAVRAWQPPIPGLPRLRGVQRRQLKVSRRWASARLGLPDPGWLAAVSS